MKINKDQARILAQALRESKHEIAEQFSRDRDEQRAFFKFLDGLEDLMSENGKDGRRRGRTSQNDFTDCLRRIVKKYSQETGK